MSNPSKVNGKHLRKQKRRVFTVARVWAESKGHFDQKNRYDHVGPFWSSTPYGSTAATPYNRKPDMAMALCRAMASSLRKA